MTQHHRGRDSFLWLAEREDLTNPSLRRVLRMVLVSSGWPGFRVILRDSSSPSDNWFQMWHRLWLRPPRKWQTMAKMFDSFR